jgi:hypothetical protein
MRSVVEAIGSDYATATTHLGNLTPSNLTFEGLRKNLKSRLTAFCSLGWLVLSTPRLLMPDPTMSETFVDELIPD